MSDAKELIQTYIVLEKAMKDFPPISGSKTDMLRWKEKAEAKLEVILVLAGKLVGSQAVRQTVEEGILKVMTKKDINLWSDRFFDLNKKAPLPDMLKDYITDATKRYGEDAKNNLYLEWKSLTQKGTLLEFSADVSRIGKALSIPEEMQMRAFVDGIRDMKVKEGLLYISKDKIKTMNDYLDRALELEKSLKLLDRQQEREPKTIAALRCYNCGEVGHKKAECRLQRKSKSAGKEEQEDASKMKKKTCTTCEKIGHTAEQCWKDKTCDKCGRKGHIAEVCKNMIGTLTRKYTINTLRRADNDENIPKKLVESRKEREGDSKKYRPRLETMRQEEIVIGEEMKQVDVVPELVNKNLENEAVQEEQEKLMTQTEEKEDSLGNEKFEAYQELEIDMLGKKEEKTHQILEIDMSRTVPEEEAEEKQEILIQEERKVDGSEEQLDTLDCEHLEPKNYLDLVEKENYPMANVITKDKKKAKKKAKKELKEHSIPKPKENAKKKKQDDEIVKPYRGKHIVRELDINKVEEHVMIKKKSTICDKNYDETKLDFVESQEKRHLIFSKKKIEELKVCEKGRKEITFALGDYVYLKRPFKSGGREHLYDGPFRITEKKSEMNYRLETMNGTVHISRLKPYYFENLKREEEEEEVDGEDVVEDDIYDKGELEEEVEDKPEVLVF
jgi:hypothetical protein